MQLRRACGCVGVWVLTWVEWLDVIVGGFGVQVRVRMWVRGPSVYGGNRAF